MVRVSVHNVLKFRSAYCRGIAIHACMVYRSPGNPPKSLLRKMGRALMMNSRSPAYLFCNIHVAATLCNQSSELEIALTVIDVITYTAPP